MNVFFFLHLRCMQLIEAIDFNGCIILRCINHVKKQKQICAEISMFCNLRVDIAVKREN